MRYWRHGRTFLGNSDQSHQDLKKGRCGAVGKTFGICAGLSANSHCLLGGVGSVFLLCACEVLGTARFVFVFTKYILVCF